MADLPSYDDLSDALAQAAEAHHDYERVILKGVGDEAWPAFHAAFGLGRFGDFVSASRLARLLEEVDDDVDDWALEAAEYVRRKLTA